MSLYNYIKTLYNINDLFFDVLYSVLHNYLDKACFIMYLMIQIHLVLCNVPYNYWIQRMLYKSRYNDLDTACVI